MAFTRMPYSASARAMERVMPITPVLVAL